MTDPRFWGWLWEMDNEIRAHIPMIYYHVWDNYPYPKFNKLFYDSNDLVATISKVTDDIVRTVSPDVECVYLPHAVDTEIFKPVPEADIKQYKKTIGLLNKTGDRFLFFWNNRNARRKMSGSILWWFKEFLDKVGHDKACLIMHTDPYDDHGQDLVAIAKELNMGEGQILFSQDKYPLDELAIIYNVADCTINVSDAEGFGLATLESLSCGTPIIVNMTGGLQQQVTDGENWFGIGIEPASKAIIGSQQVPYIYEDRISKEDFIEALHKMYNMSEKERKELGAKGREHVLKEYNFDTYRSKWTAIFDHVCEKHGSWKTRKSYKNWNFTEVS
jgi:glycosyltransferase involved in cell wall biosynthesis